MTSTPGECMRLRIVISFNLLAVFISVTTIFGYTHYTGYSGAASSNGTCASSCHGTGGGSIEVSGFPSEYIPEQTYNITISHVGGSSINQFNGSCRIGSGSDNAGLITAGTNTAVYNVANETNGIHFSSANQVSGTFDWTAPIIGTGDIKLYISGMQGASSNGQNSALVLTASEGSHQAVPDAKHIPDLFKNLANYPNPFNVTTVIEFYYDSNEQSNVHLGIYNITGQLIYSRYIYCDKKRLYYFHWNGLNDKELEVPSGVYFFRLECASGASTNKMIMLR